MNNVEVIKQTHTHTIYNSMILVKGNNYKLTAKAQPNKQGIRNTKFLIHYQKWTKKHQPKPKKNYNILLF